MIEFKAECGHTVRAKDEDAGKVVRCSYCGRETQVPEKNPGSEDLEFLFSEVEKTGVYESPKDRRRVQRMKGNRPSGRTDPLLVDVRTSPYSIVLKLCYVCVVMVLLIVIGKMVYHQVTQAKTSQTVVEPHPAGGGETGGRDDRVGLLRPRPSAGKAGLYVRSVPDGAEIYVTRKGASRSGSVLGFKPEDIRCILSSGEITDKVTVGEEYDVYVALRINDPELMKQPGYPALRRDYEETRKDSLFDEYFLPDGSSEVLTDVMPNRPMVVIRKYECKVFDRTWTPVIALFVPELPLPELVRYLPRETAVGFNEDQVKAELEYYGIEATDRKYMIDILHRIGMVPHRNASTGLYRIFSINLVDGSIYTRPGTFGHGRAGTAGGNPGAP
ncbi:MAG: hypothetical protein JXB13_12205 [Phycisphaerae bacterium]|nr:hypothetical protein [Phycisphaerae bacterium]